MPLRWPLPDGSSLDLLDAGAWKRLAPELHVCEPAYLESVQALSCAPAELADLGARVMKEGYFQAPPQPWGLPTHAMAACVGRLRALGISTVFAFVFDEFWVNFYKLDPLLRYLLGAEYRMLPDFWVWYVDPREDDAGWRPHRDKSHQALLPDGRPKSFTIWLPLTDADPLNSCMYVVPADRDPTYGTERDKEWKFELSDVRALPAQAGSLLGWTQALLHWGSRGVARASGPRISMAFEFIRADVPPFNLPLIQPGTALSLAARVQLICKQILQYQHMYPLAPRAADIAKEGTTLYDWSRSAPSVIR